MIRTLEDLSKSELLSFIYNNMNVPTLATIVSCANCGDYIENAKYYICDECEKSFKKD